MADQDPRTIAFYLEDEPVLSVCEVTLEHTGTGYKIYGSCKEAFDGERRCKHTSHAYAKWRLSGHMGCEIEGGVPKTVVTEALRRPERYRELLLQRGKVEVA